MLNRSGSFVTSSALILAVGLFVNLPGCGGGDKGARDKSDTPKPTNAGTTTAAPADSSSPKNGDWTEAPKSEPEQHAAAQPAEPAQPAQPVQTVSEEKTHPAPSANGADREAQRQQVLDALYAQIRLQMEQAIVERKQLLDSGTPASDERIRSLEGKIMKARELLIENGEDVEDVQPPIVTPK